MSSSRLTLAVAVAACTTFALAGSPTLAVPAQIVVYSGVLAPDGEPVDGDRTLRFQLVDGAENTLYDSGDVSIAVADGAFTVALPLDPEAAPFSAALMAHFHAGDALSLVVTPDGQPALPAVPLRSVPYALTAGRAHVAGDLACTGCVGPDALADDARVATAIAFDDDVADLGANTLQGAIESLAAMAASATAAITTHVADADAHHPADSAGIDLVPASVTIGDTRLEDGALDLGPLADDELTAAMIRTLTGGGDADALHTHAGAGGGGVCYTAWGTSACGAGFSAMYTGVALTPYMRQYNAAQGAITVGALGSSVCSAQGPNNRSNNGDRGWLTGGHGYNQDNEISAPLACAVCCAVN